MNEARMWKEGDRVTWHGEVNSENWEARLDKPGTVAKDTPITMSGKRSIYTRVLFDGEAESVLALTVNLREHVDPPKAKTLHDEAEEQFELAMIYARDGAIATAATMLEDIARTYRTRANLIDAELGKVGKG